jgi:hypothetical protein
VEELADRLRANYNIRSNLLPSPNDFAAGKMIDDEVIDQLMEAILSDFTPSAFEPIEAPEIGLKTELPEPETVSLKTNGESLAEKEGADTHPETEKIATSLGLPETMVKAFIKEFRFPMIK